MADVLPRSASATTGTCDTRPRMRTFDIGQWGPGAGLIVILAQVSANESSHAETSAAHVARVLLQMQPVRRLVDSERLPKVDAGVERALMVTSKSGGKQAILSPTLTQLLTSESGERTTVALLNGGLRGIKTMADAETALGARTAEIAALLDAPRLHQVLAATDEPTRGSLLTSAIELASVRGHATLTTRHVIGALCAALDGWFKTKEVPGMEETTAGVLALLDAIPRRDRTSINYAPRLVGAIAAAAAAGDTKMHPILSEECFEGDDALVPVRAALDEAKKRMAAVLGAEKQAPA
jgi:hypothetical protein